MVCMTRQLTLHAQREREEGERERCRQTEQEKVGNFVESLQLPCFHLWVREREREQCDKLLSHSLALVYEACHLVGCISPLSLLFSPSLSVSAPFSLSLADNWMAQEETRHGMRDFLSSHFTPSLSAAHPSTRDKFTCTPVQLHSSLAAAAAACVPPSAQCNVSLFSYIHSLIHSGLALFLPVFLVHSFFFSQFTRTKHAIVTRAMCRIFCIRCVTSRRDASREWAGWQKRKERKKELKKDEEGKKKMQPCEKNEMCEEEKNRARERERERERGVSEWVSVKEISHWLCHWCNSYRLSLFLSCALCVSSCASEQLMQFKIRQCTIGKHWIGRVEHTIAGHLTMCINSSFVFFLFSRLICASLHPRLRFTSCYMKEQVSSLSKSREMQKTGNSEQQEKMRRKDYKSGLREEWGKKIGKASVKSDASTEHVMLRWKSRQTFSAAKERGRGRGRARAKRKERHTNACSALKRPSVLTVK